MWKQSPKQSVYDIRLYKKISATKNYTELWSGRPLRLPLDPLLIQIHFYSGFHEFPVSGSDAGH